MTDVDTAAMLAERDATWTALRRRLEGLADEGEHLRGGDHTVPEVFAHLARWQECGAAFVEARARGERPADDTVDHRDLNRRWADEDRGIALLAAQLWAERAWQRYRALLAGLGPETWDDEILERAQDDLAHHHEHLAEPLAFPLS